MQDAPSDSQLLAAMARTLEQVVLPELSGAAQHQARVVASLCHILERERKLDPDLDAAAVRSLTDLLGEPSGQLNSASLWEALATRLDSIPIQNASADEEKFLQRAHIEAHRIVLGKLAVAKPGYEKAETQDQNEPPGSQAR